jgi:hypothetical protein
LCGIHKNRYPPGGDLVGTTAKERRRGVIVLMGSFDPTIRHLSGPYTTSIHRLSQSAERHLFDVTSIIFAVLHWEPVRQLLPFGEMPESYFQTHWQKK